MLLALLPLACGPEQSGDDGASSDDVAWLIDSFARGCEYPITECMVAHYYEFVFAEDGTFQTYDVACGIREPAAPDRKGIWRATDRYGVVELLPAEGSVSFKFELTVIEGATVRTTEDCNVVEVDSDGDGSGFPIERGVFKYEITDCVSHASYLDAAPVCPDSGE